MRRNHHSYAYKKYTRATDETMQPCLHLSSTLGWCVPNVAQKKDQSRNPSFPEGIRERVCVDFTLIRYTWLQNIQRSAE